MAGSDDDILPPPPPPLPQTQTLTQQAPHTVLTIKLPILKKGEYDIWAMKMEHYLAHTDYPIWEVKRQWSSKEMWEAIKSRFSGNDESKKMHKYILKQQFEGFSVSNSEGLHKGYDRSLPSAWSQVSLIMRTKPGVDSLSFDDLYNNLRVFETDVKGSAASSSSTQNMAFVSENTSSTNDVSTAYGVSNSSGHNSQYEHTSSYSLLANQSSRKLQFDAKEPEDSNALVTLDGEGVDWTSHSEDEQENYALMACSISGSDTEREQLRDASIEIQAYTQALKKVEAQLVAHQQSQLWYEEKIRFMKIDLDDKTDVLTYHKKLLAEAEKEKEDLKAKVEKWHSSSKNLNILLNSQMSAKDKAGLGFGDQMNKSVLSYENEVFQSVFVSRTSDIEDSPVNDRYAEGMHAVPPPMTGIYIPSGPDKEIDDSQFTYGPKQSKPSESDARSSDFNSCESNCSEETHESMSEPVVNEPKVVSEPKVWSNAPIIEEYESDSEDEHVSLPTKEQEIPSFAFINTDKHVKTPRQTVIEQNTCSQSPKPDKKDCSGLMSKKLGLGFGYTKKACFVCGSFSHLIRDCDFHEKRMAKQAELNNRMSKGSSQREIRPVWNNVQRMNHQNQFVPKAVLTRTGKIPVNTARTSGTNTVNTARHNFNRQAVPINAARKVNTVKPIVNNARPKAGFHKSVSPFRKSFNRTTTLRTNFSKQKVNTAEVNAVSAVKGKRETADYPHRALKNRDFIDLNKLVKGNLQVKLGFFFLRTKDDTSGILKTLKTNLEPIKSKSKSISLIEWVSVADFTNLETIVNVSPIPTSRINSIHPSTLILGDPKLAVQTRSKVTNSSGAHAFVRRTAAIQDSKSLDSCRFALWKEGNWNKISQDKYVAEILKKFDFVSVRTASTPIETQKPFVKDEEARDVDVHLYRSMIGSLMYLTASRLDIMFVVCACSRFQVTPKTSHLNAVKRIFRYLKGKPKLGLWYPRVSTFNLEAYSDSDYAGANLDRKSTTGEAEYVAAANCCGQVYEDHNQH
ncbi:hypothetical protein Tco_0531791 [Tanacetum coccineum]